MWRQEPHIREQMQKMSWKPDEAQKQDSGREKVNTASPTVRLESATQDNWPKALYPNSDTVLLISWVKYQKCALLCISIERRPQNGKHDTARNHV